MFSFKTLLKVKSCKRLMSEFFSVDKCDHSDCEQICDVNSDGDVYCACKSGYTLNEDKLTCTGTCTP